VVGIEDQAVTRSGVEATRIPTQAGTYALVLARRRTGVVPIGRLGSIGLRSGFYVYVGSAFGPGGLAARIRHHRQIAAHPHWHIDYLRAECDLVEVWFATGPGRHEHTWARTMGRMPGALIPMPGFGSSDCECDTHLFRFEAIPSIRAFRQRARTTVTRYAS
jgi:Uri superfamily endonuclease